MNNKQLAGAIAAIILAISATALISWVFIKTMDAWRSEDPAKDDLKEASQAITTRLIHPYRLLDPISIDSDLIDKCKYEELLPLTKKKTLTREEKRFLILYNEIETIKDSLP
jgi:hypothetical protein